MSSSRIVSQALQAAGLNKSAAAAAAPPPRATAPLPNASSGSALRPVPPPVERCRERAPSASYASAATTPPSSAFSPLHSARDTHRLHSGGPDGRPAGHLTPPPKGGAVVFAARELTPPSKKEGAPSPAQRQLHRTEPPPLRPTDVAVFCTSCWSSPLARTRTGRIPRCKQSKHNMSGAVTVVRWRDGERHLWIPVRPPPVQHAANLCGLVACVCMPFLPNLTVCVCVSAPVDERGRVSAVRAQPVRRGRGCHERHWLHRVAASLFVAFHPP